MTGSPADFAAAFVALYAAHQVADHWIHVDWHDQAQALSPGDIGTCIAHMILYIGYAAAALSLTSYFAGLHLHLPNVVIALALVAVTHFGPDRRYPLAHLITRLRRRRGPSPDDPAVAAGTHLMEQSWHIGWIFVAALVIA